MYRLQTGKIMLFHWVVVNCLIWTLKTTSHFLIWVIKYSSVGIKKFTNVVSINPYCPFSKVRCFISLKESLMLLDNSYMDCQQFVWYVHKSFSLLFYSHKMQFNEVFSASLNVLFGVIFLKD